MNGSKRPLALITGGTRGIGLQTARLLVQQGYDVSLLFLRQKKAATASQQELQQLGADVLIHKGNVAKQEDVCAWIKATRTHFDNKSFRVVILNAASGSLKPLQDLDPKAWAWTMEINHLGPVLVLQQCKPFMDHNSTVVALSSLGSTHAIPDYSFVGSSKAALEALVRQAAWEWGKEGIRINAVSGGAVPTGALNFFPKKEEILAASKQFAASTEAVSIDQIAKVVVWLCSKDSQGIQGQTIVVDAGYSLGLPGQDINS